MQQSRFEEMDVWQDSMNFCETIYDLSGKERFSDDYDLKKQIRRSAISIASNNAEGFERDSDTEFARFLRIRWRTKNSGCSGSSYRISIGDDDKKVA
jgi:hypothetical protein